MKKLIVLVAVLLAVGTGIISAHDSKGLQYTEVVVRPGDTVWSIAAENCTQKQDIREVIHLIKEANKLDHSVQIHPGQALKVTNYKTN